MKDASLRSAVVVSFRFRSGLATLIVSKDTTVAFR